MIVDEEERNGAGGRGDVEDNRRASDRSGKKLTDLAVIRDNIAKKSLLTLPIHFLNIHFNDSSGAQPNEANLNPRSQGLLRPQLG